MSPIKIDGASGIMYRCWRPFSPKAAVLLVHGLGAHSGRWGFLADFLYNNNIVSYAIELKGFGETPDLKGHIDSFDIYLNDVERLHSIIEEENPGCKIFIAGESMGALIAFLLSAKGPKRYNGLIAVSPVFKSRLKFSLSAYLALFSSLLLDPKKQFTLPFNSQMCTRDTAYQGVMDSEPREHRLGTPRLLLNIAIAQMMCVKLKKSVQCPVLFLLAGEDKFTDLAVTKKVFASMTLPDKALAEYAGMSHALSIEMGREKVFGDILGWILQRV